MIQEDKDLLLKYLCMALPYGICANLPNHHLVSHKYVIHDINTQNGWTNGLLDYAGRIQIYSAKVEDIKPYLRPMSSMTDKEKKEMYNLLSPEGTAIYDCDGISMPMNHYGEFVPYEFMNRIIQYLIKNHFDFIGLIPKGLAIEVTDENNPY